MSALACTTALSALTWRTDYLRFLIFFSINSILVSCIYVASSHFNFLFSFLWLSNSSSIFWILFSFLLSCFLILKISFNARPISLSRSRVSGKRSATDEGDKFTASFDPLKSMTFSRMARIKKVFNVFLCLFYCISYWSLCTTFCVIAVELITQSRKCVDPHFL